MCAKRETDMKVPPVSNGTAVRFTIRDEYTGKVNSMTVSDAVGHNLRRHRRAAGMSLAELAAAAGVGKSTLHALELGDGNPTLSTLWALASALQIPLGALLEDRQAPTVVVRAGQGARVDGTSVHARLLYRLAARATVEVYELAIDGERQVSNPHLPGVEECLIVTRGGVRAGPQSHPVDLAVGDAIHHDAAQPHVYQALEPESRALLLMLYP
jgi:transcriptional regulator with XRE-family HTH domain